MQQELPEDLASNEPEPVACASADELGALLSGGYAGWQNYRDQILKRQGERPTPGSADL